MHWKLFLTVFATVFVAELGDKTQIATLLFASDARGGRWTVFTAAALALVASAAIAVLLGRWISAHVGARVLHLVAGVAFIAIGAWTIVQALRSS